MSYCLEPKLKLLNSYNPCPDKLWIDLKEIILYSTIEVGCAHWVDMETKHMCDRRDSLQRKSKQKGRV